MGGWFGLARRLMALLVGLAVAGSALGQELDWLWKAPMRIGPVSSVAYTPDGAYLVTGHGGASASPDTSVRVWDIARQRVWKQFGAEANSFCTSVATSPNGDLIAAGYGSYGGSGALRVWNIKTGALLHSATYANRINAVEFSRSGSQLAVGGIGILQLLNGHTFATLFSSTTINSVSSVSFSPDETRLAVGRYISTNRIQVVEIATGNTLLTIPISGGVSQLDYSPSGNRIVASAREPSAGLFMLDAYTGAVIWTLSVSSNAVAFSPDGTYVGRGGGSNINPLSSGNFLLVHSSTGVPLGTSIRFTQPVNGIAFSPSGSAVAVGSQNRTVTSLGIPDRTILKVYQGPYSSATTCAFAPDGTWFVTNGNDDSGENDQFPRLWQVATGSNNRTFQYDTTANTSSVVALSFDSTLLCSSERSFPIWNVSNGTLVRHLFSGSESSTGLAFSPTVQELAANAAIRDPITGATLRTLVGQVFRPTCFAYSGDGLLLAGGNSDNRVRLWNTATGTLLRTMTGHTASVMTVGISPNQTVIASGSLDQTIKIWNTLTGSLLQTITHPGQVTSLAFTPDGALLYSACSDGLIRAWRTDNWTLDQSFAGTRVNAISVSKDGSLLGIAGRDATGVAFLHRPTISGHINLGDYTASPATQPVTLDFLIDGLVYETTDITLNSNGDFSTTAKVAPGEYEVKARASHWLTKSLGTVTISRTTTGLTADLTNGDINSDNSIDIADYAVLSSAYEASIGDPPFVANADLNGSGHVNIDDYNILSANYGLNGD